MGQRLIQLVCVLTMAIAACGDTSGTVSITAAPATEAAITTEAPTTSATTAAPTPVTTTTTTTMASTTTAAAPPTTAAPTTTAAPPTTLAVPSAADDLTAFFAAAEVLDRDIAAAAATFNAGFDDAAGTVDAAAVGEIGALSTDLLAGLIPAGLDLDLETAVLAVYADLNSRIAALDGGVRYLNQGEYSDVEFTLYCLGNGSDSNARFDDDLATAQVLAATKPRPTAAPDSEAAGILAVRLETIRSMNWGCDSCGGVAVTEPIDVDWAAKRIFGNVEFEATYNGSTWEILIYAC